MKLSKMLWKGEKEVQSGGGTGHKKLKCAMVCLGALGGWGRAAGYEGNGNGRK